MDLTYECDIIEYDPDTMLSELYIDCLEVGQVLLTKDSRRLSNAVIIGKLVDGYLVLSDFGNTLSFSYKELEGSYDLERTCLLVRNVKLRLKTQLELLSSALSKFEEK